MARDWTWLEPEAVRAMHREQIAFHGGRDGIRDEALLDAILARPRGSLAAEGPHAIAASYACGIASERPFVEGDERTAVLAAETFLMLNGFILDAADADIVITFHALAEGQVDEPGLAAWFRERIAVP